MDFEALYREERPRALATLIRILRDFDLAEDMLQKAFAVALEQWPQRGVPRNPSAWLISAARHKAIDRLRRAKNLATKTREIAALTETTVAAPDGADEPFPNDLLRLIFTCCHPALALEAQVALTLKTLCGLSVEEIARAFLVPPATMAQRLVRAKGKIGTVRRGGRRLRARAGPRHARHRASLSGAPAARGALSVRLRSRTESAREGCR